MGVILACCGLVALVAYVMLVRHGTSRADGDASEAMVVILGVAVVTHGILGLIRYCMGCQIEALSLLAFVGAGIAGSLLGRRFFLESIVCLGAARAETLKASAPAFSLLWATAFLHEASTWYNGLGIVFLCLGLVMVSRRGSHAATAVTPAVRPMSYIFPFLAAFFYSLEPILVRLGIMMGTPFLVGLSVQSLAAATMYLVYLLAMKRLPRRIHRSARLAWYIAAGFASACFMLLLNGALSAAPVMHVMPIVQTSPLLVILCVHRGSHPRTTVSPTLFLGALLVVLGGVAVAL